ncbi:tetratricopeptide repeat protein [Mangrovibacterium diazotrophicum]|uniref:Tetratricopeptide repeat protein n=1 Tax=Mangrovibacterium diazotrophicum TaxID=1261403 RepID=A0A419VZ58_9BACT|nr:tetratricopeptide repeat protein [Mangrovibacterium diazotrophicum]RKD88525.1 tetratricopeptide repeat protein [Mangrovibacterium diazotrophicum]
MKFIFPVCLILMIVSSGKAQNEVDLLILNRHYSEALNSLEQQLNVTPEASLYFKKGLVCEKLMDYESAISALNEACKLEPNNTIYWEELADAHSALGNYLYAVTYFKKAISIDPTDVRMKGKLAQAYISLKAYPDAFRCYQEIWASDSTNTYYNRYYAYAAYRIGKNDLAVKLYEQLAAKGSHDLNTWTNLATIYNQQKRMTNAVVTCERGLDLFPKNPSLLLKIADSYFAFQEYGKALFAYENYLAVGDSTLDVMKNYGICLYFDKQEEKALQTLEPCYEVTVNDPIVNFYMGACYKKLKRFDESAGFLELAVETATPAYLAEIYHHLGQVYGFQRKFEDSILAYKKALEIDPSKDELLFEIATTYEEFNANKVIALHYYREYAKAAGEGGVNINYALDRIKKIKEELFFEDASSSLSN